MFEKMTDVADLARDYLASERGRRLRGIVATAVIVGAPIISEMPIIRRSPVARVLRTAALGTLLVKGAEWLREWEPRPPIGEGRAS